MKDLDAAFDAVLQTQQFVDDPAQRAAVAALSSVTKALKTQTTSRWRLNFWRSPTVEPVRGLYLWGGVGRGKTFLMDLFYESLTEPKKRRVHFYRFMKRVHEELGRLQGQPNPLEGVAETLAAESRILCFDEFFVSDITDAMLLSGLLEGLFARGVTLVATSNVPPADLYKEGLQRQKFLPAIALLEAHTRVINVDGGLDYRMRSLSQAPLYYEGLNEESEQALLTTFRQLTMQEAFKALEDQVLISNRLIDVRGQLAGVIWFDFLKICDGPRSQNDYIEIAEQFGTVLISGVPQFSVATEDQARRFISLVDEFYDRKVKLIVSAEASISKLYHGRRVRFEFERTMSRLLEMQSDAYLGLQHRA